MRQVRLRNQQVVVGKNPKLAVCGAEVLPKSRLAPELSCCLQDSGDRRPAAKSLQHNVLDRKLSCCLQDRAAAVFGPERAVAGGYARRRPDAVGDNDASIQRSGRATSGRYPDRSAGIPGPQVSAGDNRRDDAVDRQADCRPSERAGTSMAESCSGNSGNAFHP
jgi:hypothetical protein